MTAEEVADRIKRSMSLLYSQRLVEQYAKQERRKGLEECKEKLRKVLSNTTDYVIQRASKLSDKQQLDYFVATFGHVIEALDYDELQNTSTKQK